MARSFLVSLLLFFAVGLTSAQAQFTVGGVTGGAPAAGINCYGDADGKISAYAAGWGPENCGVYKQMCGTQGFQSCASGNPPTLACGDLAACTLALTPVVTGACPDATVGTAYNCTGISATVGGSATIVYSLENAPAWISIDQLGRLSGTPGLFDFADLTTLRVKATAGEVSASKTTPVIVKKAPYFPAVSCGAATHGLAYSCSAVAVDDDTGDTLTYAVTGGNPGWLSVDSNGVLTGTPPAGASAVSGLVLTVTDSTSLTGVSSPIAFSMVDPIVAINNALNDNATISVASVQSVLAADNSIVDSDVTLSNPLHMSFIQACIGSSATAASVKTCATTVDGVALNQHVVSEIAGGAAGTITPALLQDAGVTSAVASIAGGNTCGASGTQPCLSIVTASFGSSSDVTTGSIGTVLANHFDSQVTAAATTVATSDITTGCSAGTPPIQVPNPPSICASVHWNCTSPTSGISVTYNDSGKGNILADPAVFTGTTYQVTATLNIGGATKTRIVSGNFNVTQAVAGAQNGYKTGSQPAWWRNYNVIERAKNTCAYWGGSITTYAELKSADDQYDLIPTGTRTIFADASGNAFASTSGRQQCSESWPSGPNSLRWYSWAKSQTCKGKAGFGRNFTYVCKDVPSC